MSLWVPFGLQNGSIWDPGGGTGGEKATLAKSLFYLRKTIVFEVRGARARTQIEPKTCSESSSETNLFLLRFFCDFGTQNGAKMGPIWSKNQLKIVKLTY